ncbi:hypothetical protein LUCX_57 [Xanthomonas phage vB_XciM_LucasX]|nr:hypothetical protein LUCX_57 [Xanthomonas phage vB_XciM_LucasX]
MYQLLRESPLHLGGGMTFPEFRRIRDGLRASVDRVKHYRRLNPRGMPGGHVLIRLLSNLPVSTKLTPEVYNDKVADTALLFTQSFKFTSALSKGQVWRPGPFLGKNVSEVILANTDSWDVAAGIKNWQELAPIRYLSHPMCTLKLPVADAQFASSEPGVAVITINVPMLATQYLLWRRANNEVDESPRTIAQFLQAYPLPNMLDSQVDIAILNRLMGLYFGMQPVAEPFRHPFYLTDWSAEVDHVLEKFLAQVEPKRWDFDTLVSHIPTVCAENLHHVLKLPEMAFNTQLQWAIMLSRITLLTFLVQWNRTTENARNQMYLNYIKRWLRYMDGNTSLRSALPADMYDDLMVLLDYGVIPYLD